MLTRPKMTQPCVRQAVDFLRPPAWSFPSVPLLRVGVHDPARLC